MKVVCICDAGVPEMLMQYMKKLPGCDVTLYTEKTLTDIKSLTTCERTAELRDAEACPVSAETLEAVREAEILVTHVAPVNRVVLDAAPNVKIVGVLRTGTENVNLDLCRERGIEKFFCGCNSHNLPAQAFYRAMGGVVGAVHGGHADRAEDQMYFEFQTVKKPAQPKVSEGRKV